MREIFFVEVLEYLVERRKLIIYLFDPLNKASNHQSKCSFTKKIAKNWYE